jgi:hypothetical protein
MSINSGHWVLSTHQVAPTSGGDHRHRPYAVGDATCDRMRTGLPIDLDEHPPELIPTLTG